MAEDSLVSALTVRDATMADLEGVASLLGDLGYPTTGERLQGRLARLLASDLDPVLLAEIDGQAVGVLGLQVAEVLHREGRIARITALVVRDGQRSGGVGQRLLEAANEHARALGCVDLELSTNRRRLRAHAFYERQGFESSSIMYHRPMAAVTPPPTGADVSTANATTESAAQDTASV